MTEPASRIVPAARYRSAGDLWLITTYFNPAGYRRKRQHYRRFREPIDAGGLPLLTVECAFGDRPFDLPAGEDVLQLRGRDVLWQKERLLNLAIARLPPSCTKVAWLDSDICFENEQWAALASAALERVPLLQLFEQAVLLPPDATEFDGAGQIISSYAAVAAANLSLARSGEWEQHGHTGYAWAAQRDLLTRHGLYDRFVLGGSDHAIAHAACGAWDSPCLQRRWRANAAQERDFLCWAEKFHQEIDSRIGFVPGAVLHLWHGSESDRRYESRHQDLGRAGFDPARHLRSAANGCWQWAPEAPALAAVVGDYFRSRNEDEGLTETAALAAQPSGPPPVAVVVPVFNGASTLAACLESLLRLDYPSDRLELLCVDNGSTDASAMIAASYAPRIQLLREPKRGAAAARNCGIRAAQASVIAFTDADCRVDRDWLRQLVAPLTDASIGIVGGRILAGEQANFVERFGEWIHDHRRAIEQFRPPYAISMNWASRREVLLQAGLFDERLLRG
ncbi:MAG TPA: glycosyltransferase, partial [Terriglobales bacterium]|nr:glycosyltransferase [Terriglobales bacterium]